MRLMRADEAVARWQQAVAIRDDNAIAQRCLGIALARLNRQGDQAVAHFERAVQLAPTDRRLSLDLATAYTEMGRAGDSRDILEGALRSAPASDDVAAALAQAYLALGEYRQAADLLDGRHYNTAGSTGGVAEDRAVAWLGVGLQRLLEDDPAAALAALDKALEHPATLPMVPQEDTGAPAPVAAIHFWRSVALQALQRPDEARKALQQAAAIPADEQAGWQGYYGVINAAHAALASKALGEPEVLARQASRLAGQPTSRSGRSRRSGTSDYMRAYMAFRAAWRRYSRMPARRRPPPVPLPRAPPPTVNRSRGNSPRTRLSPAPGHDCRSWLPSLWQSTRLPPPSRPPRFAAQTKGLCRNSSPAGEAVRGESGAV